uniref:Uncharacterized protein n=1 Tax=Acrobeloides nanus TaxID=290746 RepID=A0A914E9Z1_9BILA
MKTIIFLVCLMAFALAQPDFGEQPGGSDGLGGQPGGFEGQPGGFGGHPDDFVGFGGDGGDGGSSESSESNEEEGSPPPLPSDLPFPYRLPG